MTQKWRLDQTTESGIRLISRIGAGPDHEASQGGIRPPMDVASSPLVAGLSHMSKEVIEEVFAPCGELHLAGERPLVRVGVQDVEAHSPHDGEVLRRVVFARSRGVFVEDDVERPVRVVFHAPMFRMTSSIRLGERRLERTTNGPCGQACRRPSAVRIRCARARRGRERPARRKAQQSRWRGAAPAGHVGSRPAHKTRACPRHRRRRKPSTHTQRAARGWP